ncbi:MAG TPA: BREX-3 system P-loop-containing protein BrxF [Blastocatellia bacterium]|nr:BREX-3 system P-loop-containing protein BrxF [Blastocatellia bacterium]
MHELTEKVSQVAELYHRLILVVSPSGWGKTSPLQEAARETGGRYINVNLELSQRLLDLTEHQRSLKTPLLLREIVESGVCEVVLLDNIELLFDLSLRQDPLRLLQGLSRNRTIIASWSGSLEKGHLIYAEPGHPEYRTYPAKDLVIVNSKPSSLVEGCGPLA